MNKMTIYWTALACMLLLPSICHADRVFLAGDDRVFCNNLIMEPDAVAKVQTACEEYDALRAQSMQDILALVNDLTMEFDWISEEGEVDKIHAMGVDLENKLLEVQILFKTHYQDKHAAIHDSVFTSERLDNNLMVQAYGNLLRLVAWLSNSGNRSQACIFELETKMEALKGLSDDIDGTYRLLLRATGSQDGGRDRVVEIVSPNEVYVMWTRLKTLMETLASFRKGYGAFLTACDPAESQELKQYDATMNEALTKLASSTRGKHWEELYYQAKPDMDEVREAYRDSYDTLKEMHEAYFGESLFGYFQDGILGDGDGAAETLKGLYTWYMAL